MLESRYQALLIGKIEKLFPGCFIAKQSTDFNQGIPDLLILFNDRWAMLEVKSSAQAQPRPNQPYYVEMFNSMSFAAFIYPENEVEVLNALQQTFESRRYTRNTKRK